jgi:hypothetical protein
MRSPGCVYLSVRTRFMFGMSLGWIPNFIHIHFRQHKLARRERQ